MNFYQEKSDQLPRLLYRKISLLNKADTRADLIAFAKGYIEQTKGPDYLKFTWQLPTYLSTAMDSDRLQSLEQFIDYQRLRRPESLVKAVFPHVADEFALSDKFLEEVFDRGGIPAIRPEDVIYTIGSCFARNFARYLSAKGVACTNFGQAEDLNSPGSNQILLQYAGQIEDPACAIKIRQEMDQIWVGIDPAVISQMYAQHVQQLKVLRQSLAKATKVIVTLGNTIDYYKKDAQGKEQLVPKFLAMSPSEDVRVRDSISARLSKLQTFIRLSTFDEVRQYIVNIYRSIRTISPQCSIIFTVSPVPIDSVLGMRGTRLRAVEVDCVSKSTIRAALHEVMHADAQLSTDTRVHYLPSFEIVRWIAPVTGIRVFGEEDAASRHVSNAVLNAVCSFAYRSE